MIRALITGAESYLGTHIAADLTAAGITAETLDVRKPWAQNAFAGFDTVIHVAGIAHQRETDENLALYDKVNHQLAIAVAEAAKAQGVRQFVFLSSMSVYGLSCGHITAQTVPAPKTAYGRSKWDAERDLQRLHGEGFQVAVLRPPMIYGRGCRGNYPRLRALVLKAPLIPKARNQRSMLYIGGLCAFVRRLVLSGAGGLYFPQNREYVSTDALVSGIAAAHGKRLWQPRGMGWLFRLLSPRVGVIGKAFGSLTYAQDMSEALPEELDFAETIALTEEDQ